MKNTTNQPITELEAWWLDEPEECVPETQTELPPNTTDEPKICPCGCGGEVKEGKTWATPGCYSRCKGPRPKKIKVCHCGCGREVTEGQKWATPDCYRQYQQRLHPNSEEPEYIGLCSCGCGGLVKKGNLWAAGGCASHYAKTHRPEPEPEEPKICDCGCGRMVPPGKKWAAKGCAHRGMKRSAECCAHISEANKGKKRSNEFKEKRRVIMKDRWQDPEYQAEMSRMSTETNADPAMKQLHSECMTNYLAEHPDHIRILTEANIAWCKEHPEKKIEAAKNGHKAMAQKGNRSSIEVKLENAIIAAGLPFQAQWEHKLGVADFLVGTQVVVFADGDYWHSSQKAQEKDARHNQSLTEQGYQVLRFWEHKINSNVQECIRIIQKAFENETNQCQIAVVKLDTLSPGNTPNNEH